SRETRLDRRVVGTLREQPSRQVLPAHHPRPPRASRRSVVLGRVLEGRLGRAHVDPSPLLGQGLMARPPTHDPASRQPAWRRYLRFWGRDFTRDLDDELRYHLEARIDEYVAQGLNLSAARAEAARRRRSSASSTASSSGPYRSPIQADSSSSANGFRTSAARTSEPSRNLNS